jgi:hypothetical protein
MWRVVEVTVKIGADLGFEEIIFIFLGTRSERGLKKKHRSKGKCE